MDVEESGLRVLVAVRTSSRNLEFGMSFSVYIQCVIVAVTVATCHCTIPAYFSTKSFECGPYGFACEGRSRLRLCEGENLFGPAFLCPPDTVCNEDSNDVCESVANYIDPAIARTINCRRNERIADPTVPGCKGYILCIPNRNRFQGIKFKCTGSTVFNGYTRTCSAPDKYKCPMTNTTTATEYFGGNNNRKISNEGSNYRTETGSKPRPIDCKNYKFRLTHDDSPVKATYFCPTHPVRAGAPTLCTVFSNQYCITLERDEEDQFIQHSGAAYRKPRVNDI